MADIRPATAADRPALLAIWHEGWHDAHSALVPPAILPYRSAAFFEQWLGECRDSFLVATEGGAVAGFVTVLDGELVKLYVARAARGRGIAERLIGHAEDALRAGGIEEASLFCTAGNTRAERFYEKRDWRLVRTFDDALWLPKGVEGSYRVATHEFRKRLGSRAVT